MAQAVTYAKLTDCEGRDVYVFSAWIQFIRLPLLHEAPDSAKACVVLSGDSLFVRETPDEVLYLLYLGGMQ